MGQLSQFPVVTILPSAISNTLLLMASKAEKLPLETELLHMTTAGFEG